MNDWTINSSSTWQHLVQSKARVKSPQIFPQLFAALAQTVAASAVRKQNQRGKL